MRVQDCPSVNNSSSDTSTEISSLFAKAKAATSDDDKKTILSKAQGFMGDISKLTPGDRNKLNQILSLCATGSTGSNNTSDNTSTTTTSTSNSTTTNQTSSTSTSVSVGGNTTTQPSGEIRTATTQTSSDTTTTQTTSGTASTQSLINVVV